MKKNLLALSMLATAGLFAQNESQELAYNESGYCNTCCCSPCCCKPCCVPQPKKCIDCECYTPQFYDLQCDWGAFFDVEFLYWYARETNTAYGATVIGLSDNKSEEEQGRQTGTIYVRKVNRLKTSWDPGVRVGIGWNSCCDGWDFYLNWTYFKNSENGSAKGNNQEFTEISQFGGTLILNPWATSEDAMSDNLMLNSASAKWRVRFNQIDLEIGRKYWLSPCFNLRPYAALRGAWTRTKFNIKNSVGPILTDNNNPDLEILKRSNRFKNRLWGVGFLTGLQPTWYFCCNFALYSQLDVALLWGEQEGKKSESAFRSRDIEEQGISTVIDASNHSTDEFFQMSPILDVGIGLRWEESWCCDRYRTALDFGWEHHHWFNHSLRYKTAQSPEGMNSMDVTFGAVIQSFFEESSDLGYGGFVLRLRFDF